MYTPIVRNRQSELLAFRTLSGDVRKNVMPLLDVAAPTKSADRAAAEKYVLNNLVRTEKAANGLYSVFIDSSELSSDFRLPGNMHPLVAAADAIRRAGAMPIPVTGLHRDESHQGAALRIAEMNGQRIGVRLDATDVSTARISYQMMCDLLVACGIDTSHVFVIMDLQGLYNFDPVTTAMPVNRLIGLLKENIWAGIVVGGYGIPDQLSSAVQTNTQDYLPRVEQGIFDLLITEGVVSPIWFADYTTLSPSVVELDWRMISKVIAPKALYALDDSWFIARGGAFSSHPDGYEQYRTIARDITALDEFSGKDFSSGDAYIEDRAQGKETPGSPGSWITACVNHHVTLTARAHAVRRSR